MNENQINSLVKNTFENQFNEENFKKLIVELFKQHYEPVNKHFSGNLIPEKYQDFVQSYKIFLKYEFEHERIDVLIVELNRGMSVERARSRQRNFVRDYLLGNFGSSSLKDAALVAFYSNDNEDWRFSFVKVEWKFDANKNRIRDELTPAKRYSFLVGKNEKSHTAQKNFKSAILNDNWLASVKNLEEIFAVEVVTEEFFEAYRFALKDVLVKALSKYDETYEKKHSFAQLLLSRIMFLYFLQRKGWFKWKDYVQDKNYVKNLWEKYKKWREQTNNKDVFYSQWLKSLFFGAFNKKTHLFNENLPDEIKESFSIMPFLNGGLFSQTELDELNFDFSDEVFEWLFEPDSSDLKKGFLEIFNFTIDEALPVDVEVAVDPEMLGKVYESLIAEEERGEAGIFYTPRIEIDFMCRMSLVNYLASETKAPKDKIIEFIFDPHQKVKEIEISDLLQIKKKLEEVKIVDPAVGSASFLVGMMNILVELHQEISRTLENREENLFALKQKIILENLYGVDVKDWALMVGELRLWLSLIIETDEKYMDIYTRPLLPNLSFKLKQGDSLIQEIAGIPINFKSDPSKSGNTTLGRIEQLVESKRKFFTGLISADLNELRKIEEQEQKIFKEIIQEKIDKINTKVGVNKHRLQLKVMEKMIFDLEKTKSEKEEIKKIEKEIEAEKDKLEKLISILQVIGNKTKKDYFLWEIDFIEVFSQKGGFDIVIGNPPYVRQELIAPPLENRNAYTDDEKWRELKRAYKEKLIQSVKLNWNEDTIIDKKSDLYVYFYYQGLSLLRPGGIFCFINSNSWLDVGYGTGLQGFLLKEMRPLYIFDNIAKRSFKQADVNTVIVLIQRPEEKVDDYSIKFVAFKKPFEEVLNIDVIKKIESTNQPVFDDSNFRIYPKTKKELLQEGVEIPEDDGLMEHDPEYLPYIGNKWGGKYLRAPEIYFKILEKGKGKLVRLGDIAEVRRGFTTGANEFFYLKPVGKTVKEVVEIAEKNPDALIRVKNGAGWEGEIEARFLKPVITEYEDWTFISGYPDSLILIFPEINYKKVDFKAKDYIKYGEKMTSKGKQKQAAGIPLPLISSLKGRKFWYSFIPSIPLSNIFWQKRFGERFACLFTEDQCYADQKLYPLFNLRCDLVALLISINSTIQRLVLEIEAKEYTGAYTLGELSVENVKRIPIIEPRIFSHSQDPSMVFNKKFDSIFTELGFDPKKPIREQEPNPLPDRKALDDIVFNALGLTEEERKEVYWAVAELVKTRLEKARSV
ncbi:MAG: hypothetical protein HPY57_01280 [Ignavibacteria bacterium]|nr:hypothetical protein [Ignavibacteria bacterium]